LKGCTFMRWSKQGVPLAGKIRCRAVLAGLAWALSATLAACAVMGAWVVLSAGLVYNLSAFGTAGTLLGAAFGGFAGGRAAGTLGSLNGFITGLIYGLFLSAFVMIGSGGDFFTPGLVFHTLVLGVAGAAGGILGVNLPGKVRLALKRTAKQSGL